MININAIKRLSENKVLYNGSMSKIKEILIFNLPFTLITGRDQEYAVKKISTKFLYRENIPVLYFDLYNINTFRSEDLYINSKSNIVLYKRRACIYNSKGLLDIEMRFSELRGCEYECSGEIKLSTSK